MLPKSAPSVSFTSINFCFLMNTEEFDLVLKIHSLTAHRSNVFKKPKKKLK
jgi:hypothetical protein